VAFLLGGLIAGMRLFLWYQGRISEQQDRNQLLKTEITRLEGQIKDIASLESEIAALARAPAGGGGPAGRPQCAGAPADRDVAPVARWRLHREHAPDQPDRDHPGGCAVERAGVGPAAQSFQGTPWFGRPELVEIVAGTVAINPRESRRVSNFTMRFQLMRASEAEKAAARRRLQRPVRRPWWRHSGGCGSVCARQEVTGRRTWQANPRRVSISCLAGKAGGQFRNLDPKDPSLWPALPRYATLLLRSWSWSWLASGSPG
jgi:type IV pilus assembly protein PilN